jgi:hypothetical protein
LAGKEKRIQSACIFQDCRGQTAETKSHGARGCSIQRQTSQRLSGVLPPGRHPKPWFLILGVLHVANELVRLLLAKLPDVRNSIPWGALTGTFKPPSAQISPQVPGRTKATWVGGLKGLRNLNAMVQTRREFVPCAKCLFSSEKSPEGPGHEVGPVSMHPMSVIACSVEHLGGMMIQKPTFRDSL